MGNAELSRDLTFAFNNTPEEARVSYLYRHGYITDDEFEKWRQDNTYFPIIEKLNFQSLGENLSEHVRRSEILDNFDPTILNMDFFT